MSLKNTTNRYGSLSIMMHWVMFILIAATFAAIECRVFFEKGTEMRDLFKAWHFSLGLIILAMVLIRLYFRFTQISPSITPALPNMQQRAAKAGHFLLYAFMLIIPITGWLMLNAYGKPAVLLGLDLPMLIESNKQIGSYLFDFHETAASAGYLLIGAHAIVSLLHHYVQKDDTLTRMLPEKK